MSRLDLPEFWMPFPSRSNPHKEATWAKLDRWLGEVGLIKSEVARRRFRSVEFLDLAARTYPEVGPDELTLVTCWLTWLFMMDDQVDECHLGERPDDGRRFAEGLVRLTLPATDRARAVPNSPLEAAFLDVWKRLAPQVSPRLEQQFLRHARDYVESLVWEVDNRYERNIPDLLAYSEGRRSTGAVHTAFDLLEYAHHSEIPVAVSEGMLMNNLRVCAIDVISIGNDIISYYKEAAREEIHNVVVVAQNLIGGSPRQVMDVVNKLQNQRIQLFLRTKDKLAAEFDKLGLTERERESTLLYVRGLEDWMVGNLEYSLHTPRYFDVEASIPGQRISWVDNLSAMPESALMAPVGNSSKPRETSASLA